MKMKTYQADTMQEALLQVKDDLGPEAIILKSKKGTRKSLGRIQDYVEVVAALDDKLFARPNDSDSHPKDRSQSGSAPAAPAGPATYSSNGQLRVPDIEPGTKASSGLIELLKNEFREVKDRVDSPTREIKILKDEIRSMLSTVSGSRGPGAETNKIPPEFLHLFSVLREADIDEQLATEMITRLSALLPPAQRDNDEKNMRFLSQIMGNRIKTNGGIKYRKGRATVVMLVGPTGVGKTTTIAKLAAVAKFQQNKKVGIISGDCYRMGANEQIQIFGKAAGIQVVPIFNDSDIEKALDGFANHDLILVDTAGRSHTHKGMWDELKDLIPKIGPDEIHVVLSCSTRSREMGHIFDLYGGLGAGSVIFTKLDECISLGCIYNLARAKGAVISYLCNGQVIPDHIMTGTAETTVSMILAGSLAQTMGYPA